MTGERTKVVIVINDFLVGGAQRLMAELVSRMDKDRFDVTLVTLLYFGERANMYHLLPPNLKLHKLSFRGFADLPSWFRLMRVLRNECPHIVLSNLFFSNTVTRILKPFVGYRSVTVEHNTYKDKTFLQVCCDRILSRITAQVVAVSPAVMVFTRKQQKLPAEKLILIRNGIDIEEISRIASTADPKHLRQELGIPLERRLVISVGRMTAQKNFPLLIKGFARFVEDRTNFDLLLLGDGGLRKNIEKEVEKAGMNDRIHILGYSSDPYRYYGVSEFFVSTSDIEGLSIAHLEAFACGLPLLATHTAGSDELIAEGKNGYFVERRDPEAVCNGLRKLADADLTSLKKSARDTAENYDIRKTVSEYEKLFATLR